MNHLRTYFRKHWFWFVVNLAAAIPLLWLLWDMALGNLSFNPIKDITLRTGKPALLVLFASLACTPAASILNFRLANSVRKSLGLQAFFYALLHFLTFIGLDYAFSLKFIVADGIATKPFVLVGFTSFIILLLLALTSTKASQRWLGKKWKKLHRWVYAAGVLGVAHFFWLARASDTRPLLYGSILALLLIVRIPSVHNWLIHQRQKWYGGATTPRKPSQRPVKAETMV